MTTKNIFPKILHSQKLQFFVQLILFINFSLSKNSSFKFILDEFLDANISTNPSTINSNSQYSIQISPSYRILNTDSIVIAFPTQVQLSSGSRTCTASSYSDSTLAISSCNALSNTLTVKISSTLSTVTGFIIEIVITNGIVNPPSTYSGMISIQIVNQAGNIKEGNNLISISYTAAMFSSSNVSGAVSNLTIAFTPDQSILKGSTILFQFPYFNANSGSSSYVSMIPGAPATALGINSASAISTTDTSITLSNVFPYTNSDTTTQISFTIINILNPPSTAPLSGYSITTGGSNYQIEISPSLTFQVSVPSTFTSFTVASTNSLVNQMASFNFLFTTSNFIPLGAILNLVFPNDLPISQLTLNSIAGITKIQPVVSYSINNQVLSMTNAIASYYTSQDFHYFRVNSVQNPQSSKPTGNFLFNVYTPNNYLMYSLNFPVNYLSTPGSFSNLTVYPASNGINQITNYTFSFNNSDQISAGGYIIVQFPIEIFLGNLSKTSCGGNIYIQQGISSNANCTVTNPNNQNSLLTISGFPTTLASNSLLSFSVQNVTNNFCAGNSSTFTIGSYTSDGYSIDNNSQNISVSFSSGALISPQISRVSQINYEVTTYNFSFQIANFLPVNSSIVITFPADLDEITVMNQNSLMSNCNLTTGNNTVISSTCNFVLNGEIQTVTLSNINRFILSANTVINVGLNSIRNPRSIKPIDSFAIQTQSSTGCLIDKNYKDIIVFYSQPALTTNVSVTPNSFLNGDTTQYIFTFTPCVMINSNDVLVITFPSEISFGNNLSVQGFGDLSGNMNYTLTQAQSIGKILRITLSISNACNCIESGGNLNITLEVNNILNPSSLKPTDTFYFKFFTYDSYEIEEWDSINNPISISMLTPNILQQTSVAALINEREIVSDYTFAFLPFNIIPEGGAILIILPSEIFVVDGSCVSIIGLSNNITCTYDTNLRQITLSGGFPVKDFTPSLIQFNIKGLNNTLSGNNTTTGSFQIFTLDSYGFTIDEKINGLNVTFTCSFLCAACEIDNLTCSSCFQYGQFPYLLNGNCYSACPSEYAIDASMTKCVACNPICLTCSENSKDSCVTCDVNSLYPYFISLSNTCVSQCPTGYFQRNNLCNSCTAPCNTCNSATSCLSCNDMSVNNPFYLYYATGSACLSNCPSGITVQSGNFCFDCDANCGTCLQTTTGCTSCSTGKILLNTTCILAGDCPSDHYVDSTGTKCLACDPNCLICGGGNFNLCKQCKQGFVLNANFICQTPSTSCNIGYYLDQKYLCDKCGSECLSCANFDNNCTGCKSSVVLQGNLCQSQCNQGFFPTNININSTGVSTVSCSQCNSECSTCRNSANFCTSCSQDQILYNNTCVNFCPQGYFNNPLSTSQSICQICLLSNCDVCSVGSTCLTCSNYFFLYNGQCVTDCPTNYSKEYINRVCVENSNNTLIMPYSKSLTLSGTYFIFFILAIGVILPCNIKAKRSHDDTYFCGSTIAMIGLLHIFQYYFYLSSVFSYGVEIYFIFLAYCLVMKIFLNNLFIIIYEFYINTDKEFKYWKSSHKYISFLFFFLAYLFDFKIIRLFYSRWCSLKIFKPKFENFNLIHIPFRKLIIVEILFVLIPMIIVTIFILINVNYSEDIWSLALENFLFCSVMLIISIIDLNVNKKLNEDFYNHKKCHPEIIPFDLVNDKNINYKIDIDKRFDFNEAGNLIENYKGMGLKKSYGVGVNSFLKKVKNFSANKILTTNKRKSNLAIQDKTIDKNNLKNIKIPQAKKTSLYNNDCPQNSIENDMVSSTRRKFRSNSSENLQNPQISHAFTDPNPINPKLNIFQKNDKKKSFSSEKISRDENETDIGLNMRFYTDYRGDNPLTDRFNTSERFNTNILNNARIFTKQNDENIYTKLSAGIHSLFKSFSDSANNKMSREDYETFDEEDNRLRKEISKFNFNSNSEEGRNKIVTGHAFNNLNVNVSTPNFSHDIEKSFASNALLNNKMVIDR